jgi:UV excision repair protein RAD23
MKLTLKNLKQVEFQIEIPSEKSTVKELKEEIEKKYTFDSNVIKLLHNGKVLENQYPLEKYEIKEGNVIIMMNTKPKQQPQAPKVEEKPKTEAPKVNEQEDIQPPQINQENQTSKFTEQINSLVEMGYEKEKVEKAVKAANGDVNLAVEFLTSGNIPEMPPNLNLNLNNNNSGSSSGSSLPPGLRLNASIIKIACLSDPNKIVTFLNEIKQKEPQLLNDIKQHEEEFKNYIMSPVNQVDIETFKSIRDRERRPQIKLTKEEGEAIERIMKIGDFSKEDVIQAYFACDKNEELTANYLFEQKLRDDEENKKDNNNQGQ